MYNNSNRFNRKNNSRFKNLKEKRKEKLPRTAESNIEAEVYNNNKKM